MIEIRGRIDTRAGSREIKVRGKDEEAALAALYEEILSSEEVEGFSVQGNRFRGVEASRRARG